MSEELIAVKCYVDEVTDELTLIELSKEDDEDNL